MKYYKGAVNGNLFVVRASSARVAVNRMIENYEHCYDVYGPPKGTEPYPLERKNEMRKRRFDMEDDLTITLTESSHLAITLGDVQ